LELGLKGHKLRKVLCRAPKQKMHGKVYSLSCAFILAHGKEREKIVPPPLVLTVLHRCQHEQRTFGKNSLSCAKQKTHDKLKGLPCAKQKTHGKVFFTVRFFFVVRPL
jgi:hypothetical protein